MTFKNCIIFCSLFFFATTVFAQEPVEAPATPATPESVMADETAKPWDTFINNEEIINSEYLEFSPAFREDGIVFVTTRPASNKFKVIDKRINKNIMSTFISQRDEDGTLKAPIPFAEQLMTTVHEGPMTFDKTGSTMYFTRNDYMKGKIGRAKKDGQMKLKIYSAQKSGEAYTNEKELPFNNSEYNTTHPSIGVNDDILYFSSDRPGGFGGMDLYYSLNEGGAWGEPINLGPNVNTEMDEIFPFIHASGILFFASDGHLGEGNLDIFYSNLINDIWVTPENVGTPYNSPSDDLGFIIDRDKKNGYFSSNREEGKGEDDIYSFFMTGDTEKFGIIEGGNALAEKKMWIQVIDRKTNKVVPEAKVIAMNMEGLSITTDEKGNEIIISGSDIISLSTSVPTQNSFSGQSDFNGKFPMKLKDGEYILNIAKDGYTSQQLTLNTVGLDAEEIVVYLEEPVDCISLSGTLLDETNKATLSGASVIITNPNGERYELISDLQGKFDSCLKPGKKYDVSVVNNGKEVTRSSISTENQTGDAPINVTFDVPGETKITSSPSIRNTLTEGTRIELTDIYYNFNDAQIRPDATQSLDALASIMRQYPDIEIELSSHTDSRGGARYNKKLSQGRAENAVQYLVSQGIESYRMNAVGYGEEIIRNHCTDGVSCEENEHQFNRRTEVKVTKSDAAVNVVNVNTAPVSLSDFNNNYGEPTSSAPSSSSYPSTSSDTVYDIGNIGSPYLLVAGSFRNRSNAEKRLAQIRDMGYGSAQFYSLVDGLITVGVQEYSSKSSGNQAKEDLTDKGMKSFLKKVN